MSSISDYLQGTKDAGKMFCHVMDKAFKTDTFTTVGRKISNWLGW